MENFELFGNVFSLLVSVSKLFYYDLSPTFFQPNLSGLCCYCSVAQLCPTLGDPLDCRTPGFPVLHQLLELAQTHVHLIADTIPQSYPLSSLSSCLQSFPASGSLPKTFQWLSHHVAKILELHLQHQSLQ